MLLAMIASGDLSAQNPDALVVYTTDGRQTVYNLKDEPVVTFGDNLLIVTAGNVRIEHPLADIDNISYETTGAIETTTSGNDAPFVQNDNSISFSPFDRDESVAVYSVDGRLIKHYKVTAGENLTIRVDAFSPGVYLVSVGDVSYKIVVK